ncbi:hypothetical protein FRC03_008073 [Tulasnella sp. 419]|nr:hypothetical protein FRC03_008073 [Tulasnella sp. 419]
MHFLKLSFIPFLLLSVQAAFVPSSALQERDHALSSPEMDLVARGGCTDCDGGTTVDIDLAVFTKVQLDYLKVVVKSVSSVDLDLDLKTKVYAIVSACAGWSTSDLDLLNAALVALFKIKTQVDGDIHSLEDEFFQILIKAKIDIVAITKVEIDCIRIFLSTFIYTNINIALDAKVAVLNTCSKIVIYTKTQCNDLIVKVDLAIKKIVAAAKAKILVYVKACYDKASILKKTLVLVILGYVQAWVNLNLSLLAALGLSGDLAFCNYIVAELLKLGFNLKAALDVDLSVFGAGWVH